MAQNFMKLSSKNFVQKMANRSVSLNAGKTLRFAATEIDSKWEEMQKNKKLKLGCIREDKLKPCKPAVIQKHWKDCAEPKKPKVYACVPDPEPKRQPRKDLVKKTTCSAPLKPDEDKYSICLKPKIDTCTKCLMPGCHPPRNPTTCIKYKDPVICKKIEAPVPSFHECMKKKFPPGVRIENNCSIRNVICDRPEKYVCN